ncbi:MAG TPA: GTPase [Phycisphaerae bacterium]|nr:GTPase [Phycisphaerae bacterium]
MPANLTPDYLKAERAFRQAKTAPEKIAALEEMLATIPKHKGTEKMQADIKHRIAKTRAAATQARGKGGGVDIFFVEKQGAGQVALVGTPNAGKSSLVAAVSHAKVKVAPYPYATHAPVPGMMPFEDIQIQLVDLPPVSAEGLVPGMTGTLRNADILMICLDLSADDVLEQAEVCLRTLEAKGLVREGQKVPEGAIAKRAIFVGTKADAPKAKDNLEALRGLRTDLEPFVVTSAETREGLEDLGKRLFAMLDVVRVYSKEPGKPADLRQPFIVPRGSTVMNLAETIHRELAQHLKRARIWGGGKYDGQAVQRDHVLADKDVIELHV